MMKTDGQFNDEEWKKISSMSRDDKADMLMEIGFGMMAAGGQGASPLAAFGAAGLGAMHSWRDTRAARQKAYETQKEYTVRTLGTAADLAARQQDRLARIQEGEDRIAAEKEIAQRNNDTATANRLAADQAALERERMSIEGQLQAAKISAAKPTETETKIAEMRRGGQTDEQIAGWIQRQGVATQANLQGDAGRYKAQISGETTQIGMDLNSGDPIKVAAARRQLDREVNGMYPGLYAEGSYSNPYQNIRTAADRAKLKPGDWYYLPDNAGADANKLAQVPAQ